MAQIRCPQACLVETDIAYCRRELEALYQVLERAGPNIEPHGWGAAYIDLGDLVRNRTDAIALCGETGRAIRRQLGEMLQPALGWNNSKFTAQAAARRTRPGHLLTVSAARERAFLNPLPVKLLPLAGDTQRRLGFLGLGTLGQYAALPRAAVWQQFGRAGWLAHRWARGEDDRPIVPRFQAAHLEAGVEFEVPLVIQERLLAAAKHLIAPLVCQLRGELRACGHLRLAVQYDDGSTEEHTRGFVFPTAGEATIVRALEQLLLKMSWPAPATALNIALEQIQDAVIEQLCLFTTGSEHEQKPRHELRQVQRYLAARFGAHCLRRAALIQPGAPLPEWRVGWMEPDPEEPA